MIRLIRRSIGTWMALLAWAASPALAQTAGATLTGLVTDPSGAAVPEATVTARHRYSKAEYGATTNGAGLYVFASLPVGPYRVEAAHAGFAPRTRTLAPLAVRQVARLDFALEIGDLQDSAEVIAPVLQTETATVGQILPGRSLRELPLASRNASQLVLLLPGAVTPWPAAFRDLRNLGNGRPFVNGNREQTNDYTLDGVDMNESIDNFVAYQPSPDALAEIGVETAGFAADSGFAGGAGIHHVTRSGTSAYRGSAFEYFRTSGLDANTWENNRSGAARPDRTQHVFGATFGGPLIKERLFFFADYQGARFDEPGEETSGVAPASWRRGDFSALPVTLVDPQTGQPFPDNVIPDDRIDPVARAILADPSLYPLPNRTTDTVAGNFVGGTRQAIRTHQGDLRLDWSASSRDHLFARFSFAEYESRVSERPFPLAVGMGNRADSPFRNLALHWTRTLKPTLIHEITLGWNRIAINSDTVDLGGVGEMNGRVGIPGGQPLAGLSMMDIGSSGLYLGAAATDTHTVDRTLQVSDSVTFLAGRHSVKAGGQYRHLSQQRFFAGNQGLLGVFTFSGAFTGFGFADFLLGQVAGKGRGTAAEPWTHLHDRYAVFVQDDVKVTPRLTVNLGLRWANEQTLVEKDDRQANFDLRTGAQVLAGGSERADRALYDSYGGAFEPRVGVAWRPAERWVVRGGFAITQVMEGTGANLRLTLNPPFFFESNVIYDRTSGAGRLDTGFAGLLPRDEATGQVRAYDPGFRPQLTRQWNAFAERQLTEAGLVATAGYVGESSKYLATPVEGNQPLPGGGDPSTWAPLQERRPLFATAPLLTNVSVTAARGKSSYHGLQARLRGPVGPRLDLGASYTLGRARSNNLGYYGAAGVASEEPYWMNAYRPDWDEGPALFDVRHNLVVSASWEVPGPAAGAAGAVLGGWRVSGIAQARSGFPITVFDSRGSSFQSVRGGERPDCVGDPVPRDQSIEHWLDVDAFARAAPGTWGNCPIGVARAPGLRNLDLALAKRIGLGGERRLELRFEAFNVTNTPSFFPPARNIADPGSFGRITRTVNPPRTLQLAVRAEF